MECSDKDMLTPNILSKFRIPQYVSEVLLWLVWEAQMSKEKALYHKNAFEDLFQKALKYFTFLKASIKLFKMTKPA